MQSFIHSINSTLQNAVDRDLLLVIPETPLQRILQKMHQPSCNILPKNENPLVKERLSCALVVDGPQLLGILTQRDVVKLVAAKQAFAQLTVADVMTSPVVTLRATDCRNIFTILEFMQRHHIRHLPIVDDHNQLIGLVTPKSLQRILQPMHLLKLRSVQEVMVSNVIHAPVTASLLELTQQMTAHQVSCVVIVAPNDDLTPSQTPVGLITEWDIVQFQALEVDFANVQAATVMSAPLFCVQPTDSLWLAHERMQQQHVRRLVVTNASGELAGIVTQTGILSTLNSVELFHLIESLQQQLELKTTALEQERLRNQQLNQELEQRVQLQTQALQQSQVALHASEERLRIALEAAQMGIWDLEWKTGQQTWSPQTFKLLGYAQDTSENQQILFWQRIHPEDRDLVRQAYQQALKTGNYQVECRLLFPDQSIRWLSSQGKLFLDEIGRPLRMTGVNLDISNRKQAEEQLRSSLQEKEILLKEIHHRVKNNLQIISSLLRMQARRSVDTQTAMLLLEFQNRVQSMALIHEQLYQSPDLSQINFGSYIRPLVASLFQSYGVDTQTICLTIQTEDIHLSLNKTILCGLIINELVSNALKHAFPHNQTRESKTGKITVSLAKVSDTADSPTNNTLNLSILDNGIGIPETLNWRSTRSLGLRIVQNLAAQLKGEIRLDHNQGTAFHITFPHSLPAQVNSD